MLFFIYLIVVLVVGLVTFFAYGWDKRQARLDRSRIPESTLHFLALCGGWLGALIGQRVFRHKTQKVFFQFVTWTIVVLHIALVIAGFFWFRQ